MDKKWEQMSKSDKIEDLRKDVKTLFGYFNALNDAAGHVNTRLNAAASLVSEVADAVKKLEKRLG